MPYSAPPLPSSAAGNNGDDAAASSHEGRTPWPISPPPTMASPGRRAFIRERRQSQRRKARGRIIWLLKFMNVYSIILLYMVGLPKGESGLSYKCWRRLPPPYAATDSARLLRRRKNHRHCPRPNAIDELPYLLRPEDGDLVVLGRSSMVVYLLGLSERGDRASAERQEAGSFGC
nr:hypothetical protein Iba_chr07dCG5560 [Ipomoea batatas]